MTTSDVIDYQIFGEEMQFVEVELDPQESAIAEAGMMMYKDPNITMDAVFGDGSGKNQDIWGALLGAGKRLITGESLFTTVFTNQGTNKTKLAFAAPYPGHILALRLSDFGGRLICQKDSFLAAAKGVSLGIFFQKRIMTGLFGGEGFIMQKLEGDGIVFVHMGGCLIRKDLQAGESIHVDTGCVAAFTDSVGFDVIRAGSIKSMIFGGEGVFFANLTGPGTVWIQSLPFSRLAGRMIASMPATMGSRGEGSVLGQLGNLLDGDNG